MMIVIIVCMHALYRYVTNTIVPPRVFDLAALQAETDAVIAHYQATLAAQQMRQPDTTLLSLPPTISEPMFAAVSVPTLSTSEDKSAPTPTPLLTTDMVHEWTRPSYEPYVAPSHATTTTTQ